MENRMENDIMVLLIFKTSVRIDHRHNMFSTNHQHCRHYMYCHPFYNCYHHYYYQNVKTQLLAFLFRLDSIPLHSDVVYAAATAWPGAFDNLGTSPQASAWRANDLSQSHGKRRKRLHEGCIRSS